MVCGKCSQRYSLILSILIQKQLLSMRLISMFVTLGLLACCSLLWTFLNWENKLFKHSALWLKWSKKSGDIFIKSHFYVSPLDNICKWNRKLYENGSNSCRNKILSSWLMIICFLKQRGILWLPEGGFSGLDKILTQWDQKEMVVPTNNWLPLLQKRVERNHFT